MSTTTIDVRRSESRPHTRIGWLDSHHSFSFGRHWDPTNTNHGLLLVNNDDVVQAGIAAGGNGRFPVTPSLTCAFPMWETMWISVDARSDTDPPCI